MKSVFKQIEDEKMKKMKAALSYKKAECDMMGEQMEMLKNDIKKMRKVLSQSLKFERMLIDEEEFKNFLKKILDAFQPR